MSISNGRSKLNGFVFKGSKSTKRKRVATALRLETLEHRQLMANDVSPNHNDIWATDVNRDFVVSPLDALLIINDLNLKGTRQVDPNFDPSSGEALLDVNNDGTVSPGDLLRVINALNLGEGVGEVVEFKYEFFDTAGNSLDPNPSDNVAEFQVGVGSTFVLRTSVRDLRPDPQTLFATYHDIDLVNQDGSGTEIAALQYGEFDLLRIESTTKSGNFALQFGTGPSAQTTAPITPVIGSNGRIDRDQLATQIKTAVGNLAFSGGASNVLVESNRRLDASDANSTPAFYHFGISFVNAKARQSMPDPSVVSSTLINGSNAASAVSMTTSDGADPTNSSTALVGVNFRMLTPTGAAQFPQYSTNPFAKYTNPTTGTFQLDQIGGASGQSTFPENAGDYFKVFEATFVATRVGTVLVSGNYGEGPSAGGGELLLLGSNDPVPAANVIFPSQVPLRVVAGVRANNDTFNGIAEDSSNNSLDVSANDQLINGTSFGVSAVNGSSSSPVQVRNSSNVVIGSVAFTSGAKTVSFTPASNFFGQATFTYTARTNLGETSTATATVNVTNVNDAPEIIDRNFGTSQNVALTLQPTLVFNPGPNESNQVVTFASAAAISGETNGTVVVSGGNVIYTPTTGFSGTAKFTVVGRDNGSPALSTTATLTVTIDDVNDAPVPFAGTINSAEDAVLILIGAGAPTNLLTASSPGPGETNQTLTLESISATTTAGGTIATVSGVTRYTPPAQFSGTDTFVYTIKDNGTPALTATATVTLNITAVNDAPDAVNDSGAGFNAIGIATEATSLDVLANDSAGDVGDTIKIVSVSSPTTLGGTVTISADGKSVLYNPPDGQVEVNDTFTYTIEDSGLLRDTATVTVRIDTPSLPFARANTFRVDEGSAQTSFDVMANDLKNTGATLQLVDFTQPRRGTTTSGSVIRDENGTPADTSDDKLLFTPADDDFETVTFTYTITDSVGGAAKQSVGTVTVNFNEINDAPTAIDRNLTGTEDTTQTITGSSLTAGLSKGPKEDAQTLTVVNATAITTGGGTVAVSGGNVVYTPAPDFNGNFLFTYRVQDNGTTNGVADPKTATATVTLAVGAVNDAPIAVADTNTTNEDTSKSILVADLIANDLKGPATATDEATQALSFVTFTGSQNTANGGTIQMSGDGLSVIYQPAANFFGSDTFTYSVADNGTPSRQATGTVTINVASVNDAPSTAPISQTANTGIAKSFSIATQVAAFSPGPANESTQRVRLIGVTSTSSNGGTVTLAGDGTITYRSAQNFSGTDTITYTVSDNGSPEATANGTITVVVSPFIPSSISGLVWVDDRFGDHDRDGNRVDPSELRLGGVQIVLSGQVIGETAPVNQTLLTLADGTYSFDGLAPGRYTITMVRPAVLLNGPDYAGSQGDADSIEDSFTVNIAAPGNITASNFNFSVLGVDPNYGANLDNLASSFYNVYPSLRQKGIYAAVNKDGMPLWTARKDGYSDADFLEVVLSADGTQAVVTKVTKNSAGQHVRSTAIVNKNRFVKQVDSEGNTIVQILQGSSDLTWSSSISNAPKHYLASVDKVFSQEGW